LHRVRRATGRRPDRMTGERRVPWRVRVMREARGARAAEPPRNSRLFLYLPETIVDRTRDRVNGKPRGVAGRGAWIVRVFGGSGQRSGAAGMPRYAADARRGQIVKSMRLAAGIWLVVAACDAAENV